MRFRFTTRSSHLSLLATAILLALLFAGLPAVPTAQAKIKLGNFPKDVAAKHLLRTLDGREYSLVGLRGQVVVLEFLAVWCVHSRDQVPALNKFDDEDRERGLKIIGVILNDTETSQQRVQQFIKDQKIEFPMAMLSYDMFEKYIESKDTGVPQTLVYGRSGRLAGYFEGQDANVDASITAVIKQELNKKL